jgi:hypothetical protein
MHAQVLSTFRNPKRVQAKWLVRMVIVSLMCCCVQIDSDASEAKNSVFAGRWAGTRVQWTDGPPSPVFRWRPAKGSAPFEVVVDSDERHFAGFAVTKRSARMISGDRKIVSNGCQWLETATFAVNPDGATAKFTSRSVGLEGPWPCKGTTIENSADLHRVR